MFGKVKLYAVLLLILLYGNDEFVKQPIIINILAVLFVLLMYFGHQKFVIFCQERLHKMDQEYIRVPVIKNCGNSNTAFLMACRLGRTIVLDNLIKQGADIYDTNSNGDGAIHLAVHFLINNPKYRDVSFLWVLCNAGCPINLKNKDGFTPLHLAASVGHSRLIKWLIFKGADVTIAPSVSALALFKGHKQAAAFLLAFEYKITSCEEINK